jgi:hypothetical protein
VSFVEELIGEFDLPDRDGLIKALNMANMAYQSATLGGAGGRWTEQEAAALAELDRLLPKTVDLLRKLEFPLAWKLAGVGSGEEWMERYPEFCSKENELRGVCNWLAADVRCAAAERLADLPRRGRGQHHLGHKALRAMVGVLADYWTLDLGRKFTKRSKARRFVYRVVEHFAPEQAESLGLILGEATTARAKLAGNTL